MSTPEIVRRRIRNLWLGALLFVLLLTGAIFAAYEMVASPLQAMFLADFARRLNFQLEPGPSERIRFPEVGPHDIRLGYVGLPEFSRRLNERGFEITHQARISAEMAELFDYGLFLPYREKPVAGLSLLDCRGEAYYRHSHPRHAYADFDAVPAIVANTLLFIENRELLDPNHPRRNPAIEWDRLAQAVLEKGMQVFQPSRNVPGGSTLATQIEKYRHSPDGLTLTPRDKLVQMASASIRAYLDGSDTRDSRRRILLDYLNTVPLAAAPGHGEVHGIGDGLMAWFGLEFDAVNERLRAPAPSAEAAGLYKHVLALLISQRKPSWYLLSGRDQLDALANVYLGLLAEARVISPAMRDAARAQRIRFRTGQEGRPERAEARTFNVDKASNALRIELGRMLGVPRLYDLDRLDLTVSTTLHAPTQRAVSDFLRRLDDPALVDAAGLFGDRMLLPSNDLSKVLYSFTLYELSEAGALLRVQADSLNQPFDINQGAKLDMGSSAKLRTLLTYLEIIAELHREYAGLDAARLARVDPHDKDVLSRWVVDYLRGGGDRSLEPMLMAAMNRVYSASPNESFFTGGGLHTFGNFNNEDNSKVMDLWEATRNSVNLPFIRLMRDIVRHFMYRAPSVAGQILADAQNPLRQTYLKKFADREGQEFLVRFHRKYRGLDAEAATASLINHLTANPKRLAAVYRYLEPKADVAAFTAFLKGRLANPGAFSEGDFQYLYDTYGPDRFNLSERGYITQIHPLELWLVAYLRQHPGAGWKAIVAASEKERLEVYDWLFKAGRKDAQDSRILSLLEIEAFQEIHRRWRRLGYPFSSLVPSYASAIGSSADRPAALADLIAVILNEGERLPAVSVQALEFGADTPYHTRMRRTPPQAERIFPAEVAHVARLALLDVVQQGTARRLRGAYRLAGAELPIGGKTGTGDHRYEVYNASGKAIESKVMNRVATFAFFMGDRFYGVITAFVAGSAAAEYRFTSGLPVQLLKSLAPALQPLLAGPQRAPDWADAVRAFEQAHPPPVEAEPIAPALPAASSPAGTPPVPAAPPAPRPAPVKPVPVKPASPSGDKPGPDPAGQEKPPPAVEPMPPATEPAPAAKPVPAKPQPKPRPPGTFEPRPGEGFSFM